MTVAVDVTELAARVQEFGRVVFLISVGGAAAPHVISTTVSWREGELIAPAGGTTRANVESQPSVTLLWHPSGGGGYCLLVDGTARPEGEHVVVTPTHAVLHRLADDPDLRPPASQDTGPACIKVPLPPL